MKTFLIKIPEGMLERWHEVARTRGTSVAEMIRQAVNKDIDGSPQAHSISFNEHCLVAQSHTEGVRCQSCGGSWTQR